MTETVPCKEKCGKRTSHHSEVCRDCRGKVCRNCGTAVPVGRHVEKLCRPCKLKRDRGYHLRNCLNVP